MSEKRKWIPIPKEVKIIVAVIEWIIFCVLVILFLIVASPFLPTSKYFQTYIVPSGSMEPTVHTGSIAITTPVYPKQIHKGDIIAFTDPTDSKRIILHRIYSILQHGTPSFETKGDHNKAVDPWTVPGVFVRGKMLFDIPYLGYAGNFARTPAGFVILIIIPALILVLLQFKRIKEGIEEEVTRRTTLALEKKKVDSPVVLFLFLSGATMYFLLASTHPKYGYALFTSSVKVNNFAFSIRTEPSPTPCPSKNTDITISGNGAGSQNTVTVNNNNNATLTQTNNAANLNTIISDTNTSNNAHTGNTGGNFILSSSSSATIISVTNQTGSNSAQEK